MTSKWSHAFFLDVTLTRSIPDSHPVSSAAPGPALETFVGEGVSSMLLVNVLSGTEYSVKVIASYSTGPSEPLSGRAKTREFNLQVPLLLTTHVEG